MKANMRTKIVTKAGIAAVLATGALAATSPAANAFLGQEVSIPGLHGCASGTGSLTSQTSGVSKGKIWLSNGCSGRKYYVQIKLAIPSSPDFASPQKVGAEVNGVGSKTVYWSDSHSRVYNGVAFRICQERALQSDPCAGWSSTIKR